MLAPFPETHKIHVPESLARELLLAAERLPLYDNKEFYSVELQQFVHDSIREANRDGFDGLVAFHQRTTANSGPTAFWYQVFVSTMATGYSSPSIALLASSSRVHTKNHALSSFITSSRKPTWHLPEAAAKVKDYTLTAPIGKRLSS